MRREPYFADLFSFALARAATDIVGILQRPKNSSCNTARQTPPRRPLRGIYGGQNFWRW
jgi:hypothetical protein